MKDPMFKFEQEFMECWNVTDDINMLMHHFGDDPKFVGMSGMAEDELVNLLLGIRCLYEVKFNRAWKTYEEVVKIYRELEKSS